MALGGATFIRQKLFQKNGTNAIIKGNEDLFGFFCKYSKLLLSDIVSATVIISLACVLFFFLISLFSRSLVDFSIESNPLLWWHWWFLWCCNSCKVFAYFYSQQSLKLHEEKLEVVDEAG